MRTNMSVASVNIVQGQCPGEPRPLAETLEALRDLHQLCREGRLYDVDRWITEGKPLQINPQAIAKVCPSNQRATK
jgi:hypothetical protein